MNKKNNQDNSLDTEVEPFNSVIDHYQKHLGLPNKKVNLAVMPRWLQLFWYFIMGFMVLGTILILVSWLIN